MKNFENWDWRIKILGPIAYSSVISGLFIHEYVVEKSPIKLLGLVFIIAGYSLMLIARFQLKEKFSIFRVKGFVTNGLYRVFRHPTYFFSSLAAIGIYICVQANKLEFQSTICLSFVIIYTYLQYQRGQIKDKRLLEAYPREYQKYMINVFL